MVKFGLTSIHNGTLEASGPAEADPGMEVRHLRSAVERFLEGLRDAGKRHSGPLGA